jgi:hypothetical protein
MGLLRTAMAALATAIVLLVGAWAGGSCTPARAQSGTARRAAGVGGYSGERESAPIQVGERLVVQGQPMDLSVFYTSDPPAAVVAFYTSAMRHRGLLPIATSDDRIGHVSVFDPADGLQRSVTAVRERSGHTLVLLGVTDPRNAARLVARAPQAPPYPLPEEHRAFLGYSSTDAAAQAHGGHFVTRMGTAEVAGFYRKRLGALGYAERTEESGEGLLVFAKAGSLVSVALQALEKEGGSAIFVSHTESAP